jgi:hypothetical protein
MSKNITKEEILKLLRNSQKNLLNQPNLWRVLTYKKMDSDEDNQPVDFDVEVRFQNHNYVSIIRELYNSDIYGNIQKGAFGGSDFSYVPNLKNLINQLAQDGYIVVEKQVVDYDTEYGLRFEYNEDGKHEIYLNAGEFFSDNEKELLETSITLTTRGQSNLEFWRYKINSEILGSLSFVIACISLIISILK